MALEEVHRHKTKQLQQLKVSDLAALPALRYGGVASTGEAGFSAPGLNRAKRSPTAMDDRNAISRYRLWYRKLLCIYSRPYRERPETGRWRAAADARTAGR
jgi:hypothetical protein